MIKKYDKHEVSCYPQNAIFVLLDEHLAETLHWKQKVTDLEEDARRFPTMAEFSNLQDVCDDKDKEITRLNEKLNANFEEAIEVIHNEGAKRILLEEEITVEKRRCDRLLTEALKLEKAEAEIAALQRWKDEALAVESTWDCQAVAKEIGIKLGGDIRKAILSWTREAKEEIADRADAEKHLLNDIVEADKEISELKASVQTWIRVAGENQKSANLCAAEIARLNALLEEGRAVYKKLLPDANENGIYASWTNCRDMWKFIRKIGESR